jgi:hypothetical protein
MAEEKRRRVPPHERNITMYFVQFFTYFIWVYREFRNSFFIYFQKSISWFDLVFVFSTLRWKQVKDYKWMDLGLAA